MAERSRISILACALVGMLVLSGCAEGPSRPLLSPLGQGQNFGYTERPTGDGHWSVTYVAPVRRTVTAGELRARDTVAARAQALDLAMWRAAQVAQAQGYEGFRVDTRNFDVDVTADSSYPDPFFYRGPLYRDYALWGGAYPFPSYVTSPFAELRSVVTVDVTLTHQPQSGEFVAADTVAAMRRAYPDAEGPVAAASPVAAPPKT